MDTSVHATETNKNAQLIGDRPPAVVITGQLTASNYKSENANGSFAVFEGLPEGPFFTDPDENFPDSIRPTTGFLLTKTHCTGYCSICAAEEYIVNAQEFTQSCVEGDHILDEGGEETVYSYSPDLVSRAVHIICDPFDNIVSRFHLAHGDFVRTNQTKKVLRYPRTKAGFRSYCKYMGKRFHEEEMLSESFHDLFEDVQDIPCYNDFFRYIQWHNLAFTATEDLCLPTMIIHYENYTTNFDQTKDALLDFLDHDEIQGAPVFEIGKSYRKYFSEEEIQAVSRMFSELALQTTWEQTSHYFVQ